MLKEIKAFDGSQAEVGKFKALCGTERRFFQHCKVLKFLRRVS